MPLTMLQSPVVTTQPPPIRVILPELPREFVPQPMVLPESERMVNLDDTGFQALVGSLEGALASGGYAGMPDTPSTRALLEADVVQRNAYLTSISHNFSYNTPTTTSFTAMTSPTYMAVPQYSWSATTLASPYTTYTVDDALGYVVGENGQFNYTVTMGAGSASSMLGYQVYSNGVSIPISISGGAGTTFTIDGGGQVVYGQWQPISKEEQAKQFVKNEMRRRLTPQQTRQRNYLAALKSPEEQKARDSLRDIITEQEWRRYVTNGFLMVRGDSGRHYQIFADGRRPFVFQAGEKIASLCIHTSGECPPSDHVINMKLLVEMDETSIWQGSNITWYKKPQVAAVEGDPFNQGHGLTINQALAGVDLNVIQVGPIPITNTQWVAGYNPYELPQVDTKDKTLVEMFRAVKSA